MKKSLSSNGGYVVALVIFFVAIAALIIITVLAGDQLGLVKKPYAEPQITLLKDEGYIRVAFSERDSVKIELEDAAYAIDVRGVDINFDGATDVEVSSAAGAYNITTEYYAFDSAAKMFSKYRGFPEEFTPLGDFSFDPVTRTAKSFHKGRGLGDIYVQNEFAFEVDSWKLATTTFQDLLNFEKSQDYYLENVQVYKNGMMVSEAKKYYKRVGEINDEFKLVEVSEEEALKAVK